MKDIAEQFMELGLYFRQAEAEDEILCDLVVDTVSVDLYVMDRDLEDEISCQLWTDVVEAELCQLQL